MSKKNITKEAIQSFNNREEAGLREIFDNMLYELRVYGSHLICNWYESEEIVLKCFIKMWQSNAVFLTNHAASSFLYKLVKNECLNYTCSERHKIDKRTYDESVALEIEDKKEHDNYSDKLKTLNEYIDMLPKRCRDVMRLHLIGYSSIQIAEKLGMAVSTVDNQKSRAIIALRKRFMKTQNK